MQSFETRLWLWASNAPSRLISNSLECSLPDLRPARDRPEAAPQASLDGSARPAASAAPGGPDTDGPVA